MNVEQWVGLRVEVGSPQSQLYKEFKELGRKDCAQGNAVKEGMPEAYYLGYGERYMEEANEDARSI